MHHRISTQIGDGQLTIETGKLAKQADGAPSSNSANRRPRHRRFFRPTRRTRFLSVNRGLPGKSRRRRRFPGGYFKREGRPTEKEVLTCRMIDRPCRPLFPEGFYNDTQIIAVLLSADGENDPDILAINGASAALSLSDIPWAGPFGAVRVARVAGNFIVNPRTPTQRQRPRPHLRRSENDLVMIEGEAQEIPKPT